VVDDLCRGRSQKPIDIRVPVRTDDDEIRAQGMSRLADRLPRRANDDLRAPARILRYQIFARAEVFSGPLAQDLRHGLFGRSPQILGNVGRYANRTQECEARALRSGHRDGLLQNGGCARRTIEGNEDHERVGCNDRALKATAASRWGLAANTLVRSVQGSLIFRRHRSLRLIGASMNGTAGRAMFMRASKRPMTGPSTTRVCVGERQDRGHG
jgi:hypothetical protein